MVLAAPGPVMFSESVLLGRTEKYFTSSGEVWLQLPPLNLQEEVNIAFLTLNLGS